MRVAKELGFSALEVLVVLAITSIVLATALPDFHALTSSFNRRDSLDVLVSDLQRARSEAVAEGARTIVTVNAGTDGYVVGIDRVPYSVLENPDEVLFTRDFPANVNVGGVAQLIFDSRGYLVDASGTPTSATATITFDGDTYATVSAYSSGTFRVSK